MTTTLPVDRWNVLLAIRSGAQAIEAASRALGCAQQGNLKDAEHLAAEAVHCLTLMQSAAFKGRTGHDPESPAEVSRDALIHDLSVVLAGALHRSSMSPREPLVAAQRLREVLGLEDCPRPSQVQAVLHPLLTSDRAEAGDEPG